MAQRIDVFETTTAKLVELSNEMMDYRPPSGVYTLFLKERWRRFEVNRLQNQLPCTIDTPKDFVEIRQQGSEEDKDLMSELYMHNYVLSHLYKQSPNPYVGDVQLRLESLVLMATSQGLKSRWYVDA